MRQWRCAWTQCRGLSRSQWFRFIRGWRGLKTDAGLQKNVKSWFTFSVHCINSYISGFAIEIPIFICVRRTTIPTIPEAFRVIILRIAMTVTNVIIHCRYAWTQCSCSCSGCGCGWRVLQTDTGLQKKCKILIMFLSSAQCSASAKNLHKVWFYRDRWSNRVRRPLGG